MLFVTQTLPQRKEGVPTSKMNFALGVFGREQRFHQIIEAEQHLYEQDRDSDTEEAGQ